jgi:hypothetical protein
MIPTAGYLVPSPSLEQVREFIRASKAESTLRGYQSDWRQFVEWCKARHRPQTKQNSADVRNTVISEEHTVLNTVEGEAAICPLPALPETVAAFVADCAGRLKVGSIQRRLNAIAEAHKAVGLESL